MIREANVLTFGVWRNCHSDPAGVRCVPRARTVFVVLSVAGSLLLHPIHGRCEPPDNSDPRVTADVSSEETKGFSAALTLASQYEDRGLTYSHERPVLQAETQLTLPSGWYIGVWASQVSRLDYNGAYVEIDPNGGYKRSVGNLSFDVGLWSWVYPTGELRASHNSYDTLEAYFEAAYKDVSVRYWHDLKDYFGLDSRSAQADFAVTPAGKTVGSHYLEGNLRLPIMKRLNLTLHVGNEHIRNYNQLSYTDWRISTEYSLTSHFTLGLYRATANANPRLYLDQGGLNVARTKWVGFARFEF